MKITIKAPARLKGKKVSVRFNKKASRPVNPKKVALTKIGY